MTSSAIVQKLWNYCNILRDDLSAPDCESRSGTCGHAQADGLSYLLARGLSALAAQAGAQASGDYPSALLRTGVGAVDVSALSQDGKKMNNRR
jgi:hypothetical protein